MPKKETSDTICNVCLDPVDGGYLDVQLGPVCNSCKTNLRWAHAWLSRNETGIKGCTDKHHFRMNSIK